MLELRGRTALELFRSEVINKPEVIEEVIGQGQVCFSITKGVSTADTYNSPYMREVRGIVFDTMTGDVISRPLPKFFNINERSETQVEKLDWMRVTAVFNKRDGSMIHAVKCPYEIMGFKLKSKKKYDSEVALEATEFIKTRTNYKKFISYLVMGGWTPIFELTSPKSRIVLNYQEQKLTLLHVRHNKSGDYMERKFLENLCNRYDIEFEPSFIEFDSYQQYLAEAKVREGIEGWVIQTLDGDMYKVKTDWYVLRHRVFTFYRERDIAELLLDEQLDDIKSMLVGDGINIDAINLIETKFFNDMSELMLEVTTLYKENASLDAKDLAAKFKGHKYSGLIMSLKNLKIPRYDKYFRKYILKQKYSLDSLPTFKETNDKVSSNV